MIPSLGQMTSALARRQQIHIASLQVLIVPFSILSTRLRLSQTGGNPEVGMI